jgi:hypothetical protein
MYRCTEVQVLIVAEVQRCRDAEGVQVQRCRDPDDVQWCMCRGGAGAVVQWCTRDGARVLRCQGAEVQRWCRGDVEEQMCIAGIGGAIA